MIVLMSQIFDPGLDLILGDRFHQRTPRFRPTSFVVLARRVIRSYGRRIDLFQKSNEHGTAFAPLDRTGRLDDSVMDEPAYGFHGSNSRAFQLVAPTPVGTSSRTSPAAWIACLRKSSLILIEQNFGPHIEQNAADLKAS